MKRVFSFLLTAVLLFLCAFSAQGAPASDARTQNHNVFLVADASEEESGCPCVCHTFYSLRDSLLESILNKTVDCATLFRVLSYFVRLYTWRMLGIRQYCECGSRHY